MWKMIVLGTLCVVLLGCDEIEQRGVRERYNTVTTYHGDMPCVVFLYGHGAGISCDWDYKTRNK